MTERIRTAEQVLGTDAVYGGFGYYLAGLTDGEGCFYVAPNGPTAYKCGFVIHLRADDRPLLEHLREVTGLGAIYVGRREKQGGDQPSFRWAVDRREDCLRLVAWFEEYPLRSKKGRDFSLWAQAARAWARGDHALMGELRLALRLTRSFWNEDVEFFVPDNQLAMETADA